MKKAEEFLIAAYWNLLKFKSADEEKGGASAGNEGSTVSANEIKSYRASLHKTFGRLFLSQNRPGSTAKAVDELTKGIYLECMEHGPESYRLCSSYYYMGEIFKAEGDKIKAKAFF